MAEQLATYEPRPRHGPVPKYDWDKWLDGNTYRLQQGTQRQVDRGKADFTCQLVTMVDMLRKNAKERDKRISVYTEPEDKCVVVVPRSTNAKGRRRGKTTVEGSRS